MRALGPAPALGLILVSVGCGADFATLEPENPPVVSDGVVVTRADGSSYVVKEAVARCLPSPERPGLQVVQLIASTGAPEPTLRVEVVPGVSGPRQLPTQPRDRGAGPPDIRLVARDATHGHTLSGADRRAVGTVTVFEATCDPEPRLSLAVDARLPAPSPARHVQLRGGLATAPRS